jgi:uncharacterized protein
LHQHGSIMTALVNGWRRLRVLRRVQESDTLVSLHLVAQDGTALPVFIAGQFLTFRVMTPEGKGVPRNYSLSSDPADLTHYRISVRKEPGGLGAMHMHDAMPVGATIEATGPKGQFTLDRIQARPVLLLAGGIGITPLLSMAHALAAEPSRPTWLIHAGRNARQLPFADELAALTSRAKHIKSVPHQSDQAGHITRGSLRMLLPLDDYDVYLCGPPPFMQAMFDIMLSLGIREERIAYEFFGPARKLTATATVSAVPPQAIPDAPSETGDGPTISFTKSGISKSWNGVHRTLLDFAEAQGLSPAFSCRNGICGTCTCDVEGQVRYIEEPLDEPGPGKALLCCSVPDGPLRIDI